MCSSDLANKKWMRGVHGVPAPGGTALWPPRARPLGPLRAAVPAPVRGPCSRQREPRPGSRGLGAASRSPVCPNAFPCAQPHARGDYSWFLINFKLH